MRDAIIFLFFYFWDAILLTTTKKERNTANYVCLHFKKDNTKFELFQCERTLSLKITKHGGITPHSLDSILFIEILLSGLALYIAALWKDR